MTPQEQEVHDLRETWINMLVSQGVRAGYSGQGRARQGIFSASFSDSVSPSFPPFIFFYIFAPFSTTFSQGNDSRH
jgi:hypothetical protein